MSQERNVSKEISKAEFWALQNKADREWLTRLNDVFGPCTLEAAWTNQETTDDVSRNPHMFDAGMPPADEPQEGRRPMPHLRGGSPGWHHG